MNVRPIPQYVSVREVLQQLVRRFGLLQKEGAQCCGITVLQSHILYELNRQPNISLNDLAESLCVDTSTLSRQVQALVELDLVSRTPDPKDRRYVVLSLTEQGSKQYEAIAEQMAEYLSNLFRQIPEEKHQQVMESLFMLSEAMKNSPDCCTPPM
ncbi:MarR family winged helix-turn-helix transcriptional regulator [Brevibacillus humidisoli]|uniref:MarR family winged helix-turn-helix transcriptional regulator n=1 Tax=Brevibacillus humidisoli TaxID=2895522 RepID=UPI001E2E9FEE|nr:MarR family winged helix-turn-helix transcriptional regulator [Brevibacillus humidisoli]UFJ43418.1 MarR family winged helix-turn-helix transcriptional regulator [Brevibacillus humidisoli]